MLGKSLIKWRQHPDITIAVDWDVKHQFKQTNWWIFGFTVTPIAKVILRQDFGLKSHPINWRCPGSNLGTLVYKASDLTIGYGLGRLYLIANPSACSFTCTRLLPNIGSSLDDREAKLVTLYGQFS